MQDVFEGAFHQDICTIIKTMKAKRDRRPSHNFALRDGRTDLEKMRAVYFRNANSNEGKFNIKRQTLFAPMYKI